MSYVDHTQTWYSELACSAAIVIILICGVGFLFVSNALSGPFSLRTWAHMLLIWLGIPLLITGALASLGTYCRKRGNDKLGSTLIAMPLVLLAILAIFAWFFA